MDTKVYEPSTRALFGTASYLCEVVVLELRSVPIDTALDLRTLRVIRRGAHAMYNGPKLVGVPCRTQLATSKPQTLTQADPNPNPIKPQTWAELSTPKPHTLTSEI
jgi:hypothetical protein